MAIRLWKVGLWIVFSLLVGACAPEPQTVHDVETDVLPGFGSQSAASATPQPLDIPVSTRATVPPTSVVAPVNEPNCASSDSELALAYTLDAAMSWPTRTLAVTQEILFKNDTGRVQDRLVFNVQPNDESGRFVLKEVTLDGGADFATFRLDGVMLTVLLDHALAEGCSVLVDLHYEIVLSEISRGYQLGHLGYLGYSERQVNLGMWFPMLAVTDSEGQWITPQAYDVGEQNVLRVADFSVLLRVVDGPEGVRVAGPGLVARPGPGQWRFELKQARDITISVSDEFQTLSTSIASGVSVELYYFADASGSQLDAARYALNTAADALSLYEDLFGPYLYRRLVVVQGDFPDGMEFSGLVFVSEAWFRKWKGVPDDWLTLITAHEVAHQWWYALVGNDQGNDPYIDEALAIYCEALYIEHYYPSLLDWWWGFRVAAYEPVGFVDSAVYDFSNARTYINAVYLRGAMMMDALRRDVGDAAFFAWLRGYAEKLAGQVARPSDFWSALGADGYALTETTRTLYLKRPYPLDQSSELP